MIKKKTLLLIRKAVLAALAVLLVILIAGAAMSVVRKNFNKAANTEDAGNAGGGKDSREENAFIAGSDNPVLRSSHRNQGIFRHRESSFRRYPPPG